MTVRGNILVADDDAAIRTVLNQALSRVGHEVRVTSNASTLWRWVAAGEGDLVGEIGHAEAPGAQHSLDAVIADQLGPAWQRNEIRHGSP